MNDFRSDFPIFQTHRDLVYIDSAATTQKPQVVIDAVTDFYTSYNSNIHRGLYPIAEKATGSVETVRKKIALFINAHDQSEIVFTSGTTIGINTIAHGVSKWVNKNDVILLSDLEHHSNIVPWQRLAKEKSATLLYLGMTDNGELNNTIVDVSGKTVYDHISQIPNLRIVSLSHVSNVLGTILPISEIITSVRASQPSAHVIIDAAQSAAHLPIDVQEIDCDFLVFSGHKLFAPSGIGVLYGKRKLLDDIDPFLYGSQMIREVTRERSTYSDTPQKFESGTLPLEGIIGLGAALDYIRNIGFEKLQRNEHELLSYTLSKLSALKQLHILGPRDIEKRSSIISFKIDGVHPHDVAQILGERDICIRAGHHCAMLLHTRLGIPASSRISLSLYNTKEDIDALLTGLNTVVALFQKK